MHAAQRSPLAVLVTLCFALGACASADGNDDASAQSALVCRSADGRFASCTGTPLAPLVAALEQHFVGGRHARVAVSSGAPSAMLHDYVAARYDDLASDFAYVTGAADLEEDTQRVGTLQTSAFYRSVTANIAQNDSYEGVSAADTQQHQDEARATIARLVQAGAVFGYDGFHQNGCAAPTPAVLVLDTQARAVYLIDLWPCSE